MGKFHSVTNNHGSDHMTECLSHIPTLITQKSVQTKFHNLVWTNGTIVPLNAHPFCLKWKILSQSEHLKFNSALAAAET